MYGGIVGISCMGSTTIKSLLLNQLDSIHSVLTEQRQLIDKRRTDLYSQLLSIKATDGKKRNAAKQELLALHSLIEQEQALAMCKEGTRIAVGIYMMMSMQMPVVIWDALKQKSAKNATVRYFKLQTCFILGNYFNHNYFAIY